MCRWQRFRSSNKIVIVSLSSSFLAPPVHVGSNTIARQTDKIKSKTRMITCLSIGLHLRYDYSTHHFTAANQRFFPLRRRLYKLLAEAFLSSRIFIFRKNKLFKI